MLRHTRGMGEGQAAKERAHRIIMILRHVHNMNTSLHDIIIYPLISTHNNGMAEMFIFPLVFNISRHVRRVCVCVCMCLVDFMLLLRISKCLHFVCLCACVWPQSANVSIGFLWPHIKTYNHSKCMFSLVIYIFFDGGLFFMTARFWLANTYISIPNRFVGEWKRTNTAPRRNDRDGKQ